MSSRNFHLLGLVVGSVAGALLIVSACSLYFHGIIATDYLITGLIASTIVAPISIGLLSRADRRALALVRDSQEALRQSEKKYRQLYDSTSDAVMLLDEQGFFDCNPATLAMFGCASKEEFCARHPGDLSPPCQSCGTDSMTLARRRIATAFHEGNLRFEWQHQRVDTGKVFAAEVLLSAMLLDGKPTLQATVRDISVRKAAEAALKNLNETLEQRVQKELSELREKDHLLTEQSRLASMGEMIGNIAHQWRQPLNVLGLAFQNMELDFKEGILDEKLMREYVRSAMQVVSKMSSTIDDFRNFFRHSRVAQQFDLHDSIAQALSLMNASLVYHDITLQISEEDGVSVQGFPNELSQVLLNLLSNAKDVLLERKVQPASIDVSTRFDRSNVIITVRDNAGGIPADIIGRVFEPYFTTKKSGTGIGLYMSKMIMDNMGGAIAARNIDAGAEFILTLPAVKGGVVL